MVAAACGSYDAPSMSTTITPPPPQVDSKPSERTEEKVKQPWLWNVVLLNDEEHTYEYVIRMMQNLFAHDVEKAYRTAATVDKDGRAVCMTTHKEHAELKREQILAFGRDPLMQVSKGPMGAVIEPAEFQGDEGSGNKDGDKGKA